MVNQNNTDTHTHAHAHTHHMHTHALSHSHNYLADYICAAEVKIQHLICYHCVDATVGDDATFFQSAQTEQK